MGAEKWIPSTLRHRIRNLTPSYVSYVVPVAERRWFLVTMGTGIVAILIHQLPYQFTGLYEISIVFFILNVIIFLTLLALSIIRYTVWPEIFLLMMRHPVQSLFLYYVPIVRR
jgi:tellurite resistance protein TehA-like permease